MPWAALGEPSLGLAVLAACLEHAGIPVRVRHCNLFLLRYLKASTYVGLANAYALNDFMFTHDLDPEVSGTQLRLARERIVELMELEVFDLGTRDPEEALTKLLDARATIFPRWVEECAQYVAKERPTLVGLTCLFDQTIASIVVARRIRAHLPEALIVLGGYAMEGPIAREILRVYPWIDAIAVGEGEPAIVGLANASVGRAPLETIPNVLTREHRLPDSSVRLGRRGERLALRPAAHRAHSVDMDSVPFPCFDDYFADREELKRDHRVEILFDTLPVESSRGCWWGQRHHCVFCGIDDETMQYRARSPENTLAMLEELAARYKVTSFRFSDYILPQRYFERLLPALANREAPLHLECEVKANLDREQVLALKDAGFRECQPGIESFSSPVLARMDKGTTALLNLRLLVLGRALGVRMHYNFLYGLPGEKLEEYEPLLALVPMLYHLDPPHGCQPVEITRHAPLQVDPKRFGIPSAPPSRLYDLIFSPAYLEATGFELDAYAYYFERTFWGPPALKRVQELLATQIAHWKQVRATRDAALTWEDDEDGVRVLDSRFTERPDLICFGGATAAVFRACAGVIQTLNRVIAETGLAEDLVVACLKELVDARVVFREADRYLGLATPRSDEAEPKFRRLWVAA